MRVSGQIAKIDLSNNLYTIRIDQHNELKVNQPISIEYRARNISDSLRAYYWKMMEFIGEELGYTKNEMHEVLKDELKRFEIITKPNGEIIKVYYSTANGEMDYKTLLKYIRDIELWCIDNHINIEKFIAEKESIVNEAHNESNTK